MRDHRARPGAVDDAVPDALRNEARQLRVVVNRVDVERLLEAELDVGPPDERFVDTALAHALRHLRIAVARVGVRAEVPLALGNPGNPMDWQDMELKFMALAEPVMGAEARDLLDTLREVESAGALQRALGLLAGKGA